MKLDHPKEDCLSCGESVPPSECRKSKRACEHHCNHIWSHDHCCWCGKAFDSDE